MRNFFIFISIALLVLLLAACNNSGNGAQSASPVDNPEKPYQSKEAIKNGDVVNLHGEISNLDKFKNFIKNVENNKKDKIRITAYTIEGDPIFYNLNYNGEKIEYTYDNSQDGYAGSTKGKRSTNCSEIKKKDTDRGVEYRLSGCASDAGDTFHFLVETSL